MTRSLLIVDDSRLARTLVRRYAMRACAELAIHEAADAREALDISAAQEIDIMTIDFNMPGMNGLELARRLRKRHPAARITLLTANVQAAVRQRAEAAGIGFLAKPIVAEDIAGLIAA
ncbi:MAG: response regulator [Gammaproteobacteria bacterium]